MNATPETTRKAAPTALVTTTAAATATAATMAPAATLVATAAATAIEAAEMDVATTTATADATETTTVEDVAVLDPAPLVATIEMTVTAAIVVIATTDETATTALTAALRITAEDAKPNPTPPPNERDSRTVFVQQLANRVRTHKLKEFFEKHAGPVIEAQIVKDRVSGRSKGVGYVEFKDEETVQKALQLTGRPLENIPIIVKLTEAEKNRQVKKPDDGGQSSSAPFHRLYIGNIHFNVTQEDLEAVFEPFGELDFAQLLMDDNGRSKGYGFVQYKEADNAREAMEKMNNFELAGRPIRVGLGNERSGAGADARNHGPNGNFQGSAFSGAGGRGPTAAFDRAGGRDDRNGGGSALDDTDVAGVNFNNYSRDALMRKLARTEEPAGGRDDAQAAKPRVDVKPLPVNVNTASRCIVLRNMYDPAEEQSEQFIQELEEDVKTECEDKYGRVVHIAVDRNTPGEVYLKFDKVQGGENAIKGLNGRYFGGRMINASPVVDAIYSSIFSRARAV
ncbi:hypothetical protein ACCO45_005299 [Purpureocillium lilacinum]|uniref:Uncharacterized protein n=1 Tax=Purpureocillium lilacinum TaxID=33203 RepID=A0ACC4DW87_PURLI